MKSILDKMYNQVFPTIAIPVISLKDSKTLYHAIKPSKQIADKRLSIDVAVIKKKCENKKYYMGK